MLGSGKEELLCVLDLPNGTSRQKKVWSVQEAMGEHGGGYETRLTSYSNLVVSAGPQIVETSLQLANTLTPGEMPTLPLAGSFRSPWSYGNVPPELE